MFDKSKFEKDLHNVSATFGMYEFADECVLEDLPEYDGKHSVYYFDPDSYKYDEATNTSHHVVVLETPPQETTELMEECNMDALDMTTDSFIDSIKFGLKLNGGYTIDEDTIDIYEGWNKNRDMWRIEVEFDIHHK